MAIKITDEIITDRGLTNELYINIRNVEYDKATKDLIVTLNTYKNQADRDGGNKCRTFVIPATYRFDFDFGELTDNAFVIAYNKLTSDMSNLYEIEKI